MMGVRPCSPAPTTWVCSGPGPAPRAAGGGPPRPPSTRTGSPGTAAGLLMVTSDLLVSIDRDGDRDVELPLGTAVVPQVGTTRGAGAGPSWRPTRARSGRVASENSQPPPARTESRRRRAIPPSPSEHRRDRGQKCRRGPRDSAGGPRRGIIRHGLPGLPISGDPGGRSRVRASRCACRVSSCFGADSARRRPVIMRAARAGPPGLLPRPGLGPLPEPHRRDRDAADHPGLRLATHELHRRAARARSAGGSRTRGGRPTTRCRWAGP